MSKQRRSITVGDLVRIDEWWSADYRRLYAFQADQWWFVETTYPLTKRSIVCVLQPGNIPVRRAHLKRPRMKKKDREALLAALQRKAAVDFFADIPAPPGPVSGVLSSAAGAGGEPATILPSDVGHAEPGGDEGPGSFINELASDTINPGGPQWPQEP